MRRLGTPAARPLPEAPPAPPETGLEKLLLFPEKIASLAGSGAVPDPLYPVSVELSLTNRCNLGCVYCSDAAIRGRPDRLDHGALKRLFGDLAAGGARGVVFEGGGEPLLSGGFARAAEDCLAAGLSAGLITNGLLLFSGGAPAGLLRRFQWIRVSLDASTAAQYRALKGADGFGRALANIGALCRLGPPGPAVGAGYVLTSLNDDPRPLRELAARLRDMGADYLQIRPVVDHPELESRRDPDRDLAPALAGLDGPTFNVNLAPLRENLPAGNLGLPCRAHSLSAVICADGRVFVCGRLNSDPDFPPMGVVGPAPGDGFGDVWRGDARAAQSALLLDPGYCAARCPRCRMTKYNRLLAGLARIKTPDFI
ncbi:MAG: radical SAM protein [Deltaproteobacteria bacterium]|nr:radical SAM protein [Deltaproteobacteria bacterium]